MSNMTKLTTLGVVIAVIGLILLVGSAVACPAKNVAIPTSLFVLLAGIVLYALGSKKSK
jgi:high-affinity Fe2+/Pb2+ permease